jgi:hypothetical protein
MLDELVGSFETHAITIRYLKPRTTLTIENSSANAVKLAHLLKRGNIVIDCGPKFWIRNSTGYLEAAMKCLGFRLHLQSSITRLLQL